MTSTKRGLFFVFLLLLVVTGCIVYNAYGTLKSAENQNRYEIEQGLKNGATGQAALVTVWYGAIDTQIRSFLGQDMIRLFASEVDSHEIDPSELLAVLFKQDFAKEKNALSQDLVDRTNGVQRMSEEFCTRNDFRSIAILTRDFTPYIKTGNFSEITPDQKKLFEKMLQDRKPKFFPIQRIEKELFLTAAYPVFAPSYVDPKGTRVIAIAVLTTSVQKIISAVDQNDMTGFFTSAILERDGKKLTLIDPLYPGGKRELVGSWEITKNKLPFAVRNVPTRAEKLERGYTLALPLDMLPWFVVQGVQVATAESTYMRFRKNTYFSTGVLLGLVVIFVIAFWWWGIGRRERAQAEELRQLYSVASEQEQILNSVNSALSQAIVLIDLSGKIFYVNQKFAALAQMDAEQMIGLSAERLPIDLAKSLEEHTNVLCQNPKRTDFRDTILSNGETRQYLTSCSPCVDEESYLVGIVSVYNDVTDLLAAQEKAQRLVLQMVQAFLCAIESFDPYLRGQSANTAALSVEIAKMMGHTDQETIETVRIAALLSQIGMIQLPRELLTKSGTFTKEERQQLEKHIIYAQRTLSNVEFGLPVLQAISEMYERCDGSGYPKHLMCDQICFNAKILGLANTFSALIKPRSYRKAMDISKAIEILEARAAQYDPTILDALKKFINTEEGRKFCNHLLEDKH